MKKQMMISMLATLISAVSANALSTKKALPCENAAQNAAKEVSSSVGLDLDFKNNAKTSKNSDGDIQVEVREPSKPFSYIYTMKFDDAKSCKLDVNTSVAQDIVIDQ